VPWFATVKVVRLQLAFAVLVVAHNFTVLSINVAGDVAESLSKIEMI
jgi:hypothetical protein